MYKWTILIMACLTAIPAPAKAEMPWYPSPYGADDRLGALNNLSLDSVRQAASLIKTGKVYSLAIPTGPDTVAYGTRKAQIHVEPIYIGNSATYGNNRLQGFDDLLISHLGVGTQIDGFAHVAIDGRHYNGIPTQEVIRPDGAIRYGIHEVPPIVGRGVLLDMASASGEPALGVGAVFNRKELEAAAAGQGVELRKGDIVLLHTGHLVSADGDYTQVSSDVPGLGVRGAEYLADIGVVAIGMDAWIPDAMPAEDPRAFLPVHGTLLVKRGVHILENIRTAELAADRAYEFFFVLAAPRIKGAVQSIVHPIAIR